MNELWIHNELVFPKWTENKLILPMRCIHCALIICSEELHLAEHLSPLGLILLVFQ